MADTGGILSLPRAATFCHLLTTTVLMGGGGGGGGRRPRPITATTFQLASPNCSPTYHLAPLPFNPSSYSCIALCNMCEQFYVHSYRRGLGPPFQYRATTMPLFCSFSLPFSQVGGLRWMSEQIGKGGLIQDVTIR